MYFLDSFESSREFLWLFWKQYSQVIFIDTTILEAMVNSPFKAISGKVIYYNTKDNSIFRVVEFKYAYIVYYKEVYNVDRKRQMYSTITFSADIIMIGDAYLSNQW